MFLIIGMNVRFDQQFYIFFTIAVICTIFFNKIDAELVNREKCLVECAGYITMACNQQRGVTCRLA